MDRVSFRLNGELRTVGCEVSSDVMLLDYLREGSELRGTKYMCREGGCGACVVAAARPGEPPRAVNSCLVSVTSCQDWDITTIEDVGNRLKGYHPLQKTLAKYNGTQCGYCSPGWVMAMYSLLKSEKKLTMLEIEKSLGSNLCRCTGYRPILEAFKKFASDSPDPLLDIEDLSICKKNGQTCRKTKCSESEWCMVEAEDVEIPRNIEILLKDGKSWTKVQTVNDVFEVLRRKGRDSYMLVAGNTAKGAYPIDEYPRVLIDISDVAELKGYHFDQNLVLGAGTTLSETIDIFEHIAAVEADFWYLEKLREHLLLVAHIPVRNLGTIAGNLMIKHQHHDFQSDIFLLLETVGAYITILDSFGFRITVTPEAFLNVDMHGKVILNILLPPLGHDYKFVSYKIMPRAQNAHAIVNAGFLYRLCSAQSNVCEARMVYGGLSPAFVHARETERCLLGRNLFTNDTLQDAIRVLQHELVVVENPPEPSAKYRRNLAINLFYKGLLSLCPSKIVSPRLGSGGIALNATRPVSDARQIFTTNPALYPLNKPVQKVEALIQCAGEAPYTEDLQTFPREVFAAYVLARIPLGDIAEIDASAALHLPGVIAFYSAKDIPGTNSFTPAPSPFFLVGEEVFSPGPIKYHGQLIGVVVAETRQIAERAAKFVHIKYKNVKIPVIDIKEAKKDPARTKMIQEIDGGTKGTDVVLVIKGEETIYQQYHMCMETLVCVSKPTEEGIEVHPTSQHMDGVQVVIKRALKIPEHKIDVYVRRLGGAYGVKISRGNQVAVACALVTHKLNRPCRIILPLTTHTKVMGKRLPCSTDYEAAVDATGKLQYVNENLNMDHGFVVDEPFFLAVLDVYNNCYEKARWNLKVFNVLTDTASNSWCRSPGTLEAISSAEFILERIAYELSLDPLEVRLRNLDPAYTELREMVERIKKDAQYEDRRASVDKFNKQNRWKKRGLRFSLLRWTPFGAQYFDITLSVYHDDGSVSITHGGIEMGQGLNTKAVQVAAFLLGIPMDKIQIKGNNTISNPNGFISGGSLTSINIATGVQRCCEKLLLRLAPVRATMPDATWEVLIKAAFNLSIDLQTHGFVSNADMNKVDVFGVTLAEVEVDVLTGEWEPVRIDILQDAGQSVSPEIDIGQVEGAFIMGLGYWTCEQLVYDPHTGELLTDRTWNYHVPQARDIPQDFRVYFRNKSYSEPRFFGAKSIGEPPICMSVAVPFALREAISAARLESGIPSKQWFQIVGSEISSDVMLLDFLREGSELRGTKYMCREGGCGACVVAAARPGEPPRAVNSCLVSITSCQDWDITTVEGVGNRLKGYHPLQKTLAKHNGTQCGYCSPGWIMSMFSLLQSEKNLTMMDIEQSLASNICRCTGYRPILDAFKRFASDAPEEQALLDIEDLSICKKDGKACDKSKCSESEWCMVEAKDLKQQQNIEIDLKDSKYFTKVQGIDDIFEVLRRQGDDCYMLVAGNTAKGAYPIDEYPKVLVDISSVKELKEYHLDQNLVIGAGSTLTETLRIFQNVLNSEDSFWYLENMTKHMLWIAHVPVRNLGTIGGNLMIKHKHRDFPSDIFLLLETVGAYLTILDSFGTSTLVTPEAFLDIDMRGKIILNVLLPPMGRDYKLVSFKIMPRAQNAHAIVNAGFLYRLGDSKEVREARIVIGGLSPEFVHAENTEKFLIGKQLFTNSTLQAAIEVLEAELVVVENPPEPSVEYRRNLAINLFYKGLLSICPSDILGPRFSSGGVVLSSTRPVSKARQVYTTNPILYPINKPVEKLEALIQCAGEAPYSEDHPHMPQEVFGAFVISSVALGDIIDIDTSDAFREPGVIAFYSHKDIPGVNSFTPGDSIIYLAKEEVFCSGAVKYHGQVIGLIVAETRQIAEKAAKLVHVKYANIREPVIDIKEAKKDSVRTKMAKEIEGETVKIGLLSFMKGEETIYSQYHFCMETLVCVTKPTEEGIEVHSATQHLDGVQVMISRALKIPEHKIDVYIRRLGGGYGEKISRSTQVAVACALVTQKLNRPCRIALPITTHMKAVGKRLPCSVDYEVAVDILGKVQYGIENLYMDNGYVIDEPLFIATLDPRANCYSRLRWHYRVHSTTTDTASNTWCRSPGTLEAISMMEHIMERIAYEKSLDPIKVRLLNLDPLSLVLIPMVERVKLEGNYAERRRAVDEFNKQNRWKKRGLRFSLLRWTPFAGQYLDVTLSVYHDDGTVSITHSGIEMGQGLNTKAAQIAAFFLKIPIEKIQVKGNNTTSNPNSFITGGSLTSINVGMGVQRCCEKLLIKLAPIKALLIGAPWEKIVKAAFVAGIDLMTHGFVRWFDLQIQPVYGVTLAETELDVLTGEWEITRVDLLHDAGLAISPEIDMGQVEGAFIMGLGYWTTEHLVYDKKTGELLTDRTWTYHVPQARDIPQDFRVYFRNNSYSEPRFLGAKSIGEPSICMAVAIPFALREAIVSARSESGIPSTQWFQIEGPYTREAIQMATKTKYTDFKFN